MNDSETYIGEDERRYVSPTLSRDEQLGFIDALRETMGRNTAEINAQTEQLGTDVPSNLGGLTGADSYFMQRYQAMPLESEASVLKSTAQAKALNDLLSNYETQMKSRAQQAYRNAQRRSRARSLGASGGGAGGSGSGAGGNNGNGSTEGSYNEGEPVSSYTASFDMLMPTSGWPEGTSVSGYGTLNGNRFYQEKGTGKILYSDNPDYARGSDGYYYDIGQLKAEKNTISGLLNGTYWMSDQQLADRAAKQNKG